MSYHHVQSLHLVWIVIGEIGWLKNIRLDIPFPYFNDNDIQRKWCQTFETKNISKNKKVLLETKDVFQGLDWELNQDIEKQHLFGKRDCSRRVDIWSGPYRRFETSKPYW